MTSEALSGMFSKNKPTAGRPRAATPPALTYGVDFGKMMGWVEDGFAARWAGKRVRFPNLLTARDLFGENQEIRKRLWLMDLSAYLADRGYRPIGLLTKLAVEQP